jgi:hypothetical protein
VARSDPQYFETGGSSSTFSDGHGSGLKETVSSSDPFESDYETFRSTQEGCRAIRRRIGDEAWIDKALCERWKSYFRLGASQRRANAIMYACAKAQMLNVIATRIEPVRILKPLWIAGAGCEEKNDERVLWNANARHIDIFHRLAPNELDRRVKSQEFLGHSRR